MRTLALAFATALVAAACGGAAAPSPSSAPPASSAAATATASAAPSQPVKVTFTAELKTTNEVPPIANDEAAGSGKATVVFDITRDEYGVVTGAKASFDITLTGFPATTAITLAHIHQAPAGQNGGVKVGIKTDAANKMALSGGAGSITVKDVAVDGPTAQAILDKPGDYYVNVHSATNPGGVVRGQLVMG